MLIKRLSPTSLPDSEQIGYSQISVVEPGRIAYVSGQVATRRDSDFVPTDLSEQTRIVVSNLQAALAELNASAQDIVLLRVYMVDLNDESLSVAFPILLDMLAGAKPCITGIGVQALAGAELQIEVEMTVRVPD